MPDDLEKNPVEGKGEEMLPQRGLPFNDSSEETPLSSSSEPAHEDSEMMSALSTDEIAAWEEQLADDLRTKSPEQVPGLLSLEGDDEDAPETFAAARTSRELTAEEQELIASETASKGTTILISPDESAEYQADLVDDFAAPPATVIGTLSAEEDPEGISLSAVSRDPIEISEAEMTQMMLTIGEVETEVLPATEAGQVEQLQEDSGVETVTELEAVAEETGLEDETLVEVTELETNIPEDEVAAEDVSEEVLDLEQPSERFSEADMGVETLEEPPRLEEVQDGGMSAGFVVEDAEINAMVGEALADPSVPPPEAMRGAPLFSEAAFLAPGAVEGLEGAEAPEEVGDLKASKKMLKLLVTEERINQLWNRTDELRDAIAEHIDSVEIARVLLNQLRGAKTLLLSGEENYEEAERRINEVGFRIAYTERSKTWKSIAYRMLIYEVVWLVLLMVGAVVLPLLTGSLVENLSSFGTLNIGGQLINLRFPDFITPEDVFNSVGGMMWGGFGGVVGALYALWRHVSRDQDFNPQHNMWYLTQPLMGLPIGAFVFLFVKLGFSFVAGASDAQIASPFFVYLLAWIAGFQQNVVYDIVRQILKRIKIKGGEDEEPNSQVPQDAAG